MATSGSLRSHCVSLFLLSCVSGLALSGCQHLAWSNNGALRECYPAERRLIEAKVARSRGHPTAAEAINAALLVVYGRVVENGAPVADQELLLVTADRRAEGLWTLHGSEVIGSMLIFLDRVPSAVLQGAAAERRVCTACEAASSSAPRSSTRV